MYTIKQIRRAHLQADGKTYVPTMGRRYWAVLDGAGNIAMEIGLPLLYDGPEWAQNKANLMNLARNGGKR